MVIFINHLAYVVGYVILWLMKYAVYTAIVVSGTLYLNALSEFLLEKYTPVKVHNNAHFIWARAAILTLCLVFMLFITSGLYKIIGIR